MSTLGVNNRHACSHDLDFALADVANELEIIVKTIRNVIHFYRLFGHNTVWIAVWNDISYRRTKVLRFSEQIQVHKLKVQNKIKFSEDFFWKFIQWHQPLGYIVQKDCPIW